VLTDAEVRRVDRRGDDLLDPFDVRGGRVRTLATTAATTGCASGS
jgi:hypothetical protein